MIEKYYNEDKTAIAVLVSNGWGWGWSTWNDYEGLAYDKRVVEKFIEGYSSEEIEAYCKNKLGYKDIYTGGWDNCELYWVPVDTKFHIYEYDGYECLITEDKMETA